MCDKHIDFIHSLNILIMSKYYTPIIVIVIATAYDAIPIHTIHMKNVIIFSFGCFRQSGSVNHNTHIIGHLNI